MSKISDPPVVSHEDADPTVADAPPVYHRDADPKVVLPSVERELSRAVTTLLSPGGTDTAAELSDSLETVDDILLYFGLTVNEWVVLGICGGMVLYFLVADSTKIRTVDPDVFLAAASTLPPVKAYAAEALRITFWAVLFRTALGFVYTPIISVSNGALPSYWLRRFIGGVTALLLFLIVGLIALVFGQEGLVFGFSF